MMMRFREDKNLIGHANVRVGIDTPNNKPLQTATQLYDTLSPLLDAKPDWRLVAVSPINLWSDDNIYVPIVNKFKVYENDEELGEVSVEQHGRSGTYKVAVLNDRIVANKVRSGPYRTESIDKAQLAIRKNFYPLDPSSIVHKTVFEAVNLLESLSSTHEHQSRRARNAFLKHSDEFVFRNIDLYVETMPQTKELREAMEDEKAMYETLAKFHAIVNESRQFTLVIVKEGVYIVATRAVIGEPLKFTLCEELPYELKGKVGMLQMLEPTQSISSAGVRLSKIAFLIVGAEQ